MNDAGARYLVVGAYAVIFHTEPRYTKDLDVWVDPTPENAAKVWNALAEFGAPLADVTMGDLCDPALVYQVGVAPNRFDVLMAVEGLAFSEAWDRRVTSTYAGQLVHILGLDDVIRAKTAAGRPQDLIDLKSLELRKRRGRPGEGP